MGNFHASHARTQDRSKCTNCSLLADCREHGMSSATFYKWRSKFGGMDASMMSRLKQLEDENRRLKKMYAEERLKSEIIQEAMAKKW